jgi:uncharacterized protein (DUF1330 family)
VGKGVGRATRDRRRAHHFLTTSGAKMVGTARRRAFAPLYDLVTDATLATEKPMSVYYIAEHIITDPVKFEEYRIKVAPMIASYGGRYITKAGSHKFPESPHWKPERVVIIEFPDMERLNAWYTSAEYQPLMALRKESTDEKDMVITVEGA